MKKILLVADEKDPDIKDLISELRDNYKFIIKKTSDEGISFLKSLEAEKKSADIYSIIIDVPSKNPGTRELIEYVDHWNNYLFAISIFLLIGKDSRKEDLEYLGGPVIDCAGRPFEYDLVRNRIENSIQMINSVSFNEFARMLKVLPANIYLKDANGRYVFSSQTWHHLDTEDDPNWTIKGKTDLEIRKDKENAMLAYKSDLKMLESGKGTRYIIEENEDGVQEYLELIKEPLFGEDGRVRGIIALINNVTEQERMRQTLKKNAITDSLTGVYNRTHYDEFIHKELENVKYPVSIITADCDHLKMINDTYGHVVGDEYIRLAVTLFHMVLPHDAVIFRTGGDEFVIFIPGTDSGKTQDYIGKMREAEKSYHIKGNTLSVSLGFSIMESAEDNYRKALKASDEDMYNDKQSRKSGRTE